MNKYRRKVLNAIENKLSNFESENDPSQDLSFFQEIHADLESVKEEEQEAFDNLPEGLQQAERGSAMEQAIDNLDNAMDAIQTCIDAAEETLQEEESKATETEAAEELESSYEFDSSDLDSAVSYIQDAAS